LKIAIWKGLIDMIKSYNKGYISFFGLLLTYVMMTFISAYTGIFDFIPSIYNQIYTLLLPIVLYFIFFHKDFRDYKYFNILKIETILLLFLISYLILPTVGLLSIIGQYFVGNQVGEMIKEFTNGYGDNFIVLTISLAVFPSIFEELAMRGIVLNYFKSYNIHFAAIMNGVLFGIFHLNFGQFIYTFFLGIIFAYAVIYTRSIFSGIFLHFLNNFRQVSILVNNKDIDISQSIELPGMQELLILAGISVITMFLVVIIFRRIKKISGYKASTYEALNVKMIVNPFLCLIILFFIAILFFIS
jgi:membrane protease YdiL (CAAX protease family)